MYVSKINGLAPTELNTMNDVIQGVPLTPRLLPCALTLFTGLARALADALVARAQDRVSTLARGVLAHVRRDEDLRRRITFDAALEPAAHGRNSGGSRIRRVCTSRARGENGVGRITEGPCVCVLPQSA